MPVPLPALRFAHSLRGPRPGCSQARPSVDSTPAKSRQPEPPNGPIPGCQMRMGQGGPQPQEAAAGVRWHGWPNLRPLHRPQPFPPDCRPPQLLLLRLRLSGSLRQEGPWAAWSGWREWPKKPARPPLFARATPVDSALHRPLKSIWLFLPGLRGARFGRPLPAEQLP